MSFGRWVAGVMRNNMSVRPRLRVVSEGEGATFKYLPADFVDDDKSIENTPFVGTVSPVQSSQSCYHIQQHGLTTTGAVGWLHLLRWHLLPTQRLQILPRAHKTDCSWLQRLRPR